MPLEASKISRMSRQKVRECVAFSFLEFYSAGGKGGVSNSHEDKGWLLG